MAQLIRDIIHGYHDVMDNKSVTHVPANDVLILNHLFIALAVVPIGSRLDVTGSLNPASLCAPFLHAALNLIHC
uniref:Uncharacterized protein n=1 Tax=Timema bartmani TaxID=61472 RepID=A0A7R9EXI8_9NEOP|nr:unnamed protein product [Timema bartmani]